jgi:chromosome segregation ATPase
MHDLTRAKRNVNQLTIKLHGTTIDTSKAASIAMPARGATFDAARASSADGSDQLAVSQSTDQSSLYQEWKAELEKMKAQYEGALLELHSNKQALESLKNELVFCIQAKDEAVRLAGEAMNAAEKTARRVEELSRTLYATPKGTCVELLEPQTFIILQPVYLDRSIITQSIDGLID